MYLKNFLLENFRKYRSANNVVEFSGKLFRDNSDIISSTLLVGQNNSGKTSIVAGLCKATQNEKFYVDDFNYEYLNSILKYYEDNKNLINSKEDDKKDEREKSFEHLIPFIKFSFEIRVDAENEDSEELITNIVPLLCNDLDSTGIVKFYSKYEVSEKQLFIDSFLKFVADNSESLTLRKYIDFLKTIDFEYNVYLDEECANKVEFKVSSLINVTPISFATLQSKSRLSKAFNNIYSYKIKQNPGFKNTINDLIKNFNDKIDSQDDLKNELVGHANKALSTTVSKSKAQMALRSNLKIETLLQDAVEYIYKDGEYEIPEDQFGMGYTCLMLIIAELIEYLDVSPESEFKNKINILIIEEPECYMHPQLQSLFIKNINDAVQEIIKDTKGKIACQTLITTHSSLIVKGKLDVENTFNNIDYAISNGLEGKITCLNDESIKPDDDKAFTFLKKHVQLNACDLFFADACIAVEGFAEETLIPYWIDNDESLSKLYISMYAIGGAYFNVYKKLFHLLGIPVVIITDLDPILPDEENGKKFEKQITSLDGIETSNPTFNEYELQFGKDFYKEDGSVFVTTQSIVDKYYPSSFEEALILENKGNDLMDEVIKEIRPRLYKKKVDGESSLFNNSHYFQIKLDGNKGEFATKILYELTTSDSRKLEVPRYIKFGFDFIKTKLGLNEEKV